MRRTVPRFSILAVSSGIMGLFAIGYPADVRIPQLLGRGLIQITPFFC